MEQQHILVHDMTRHYLTIVCATGLFKVGNYCTDSPVSTSSGRSCACGSSAISQSVWELVEHSSYFMWSDDDCIGTETYCGTWILCSLKLCFPSLYTL
jgi:hypothetical protein